MIYIGKSLKKSLKEEKNNKYLYLSENRHKLMVLILHNKMCLHRKSFNSEANISNISQIFHVLLNRNIWKYEIFNITIFDLYLFGMILDTLTDIALRAWNFARTSMSEFNVLYPYYEVP